MSLSNTEFQKQKAAIDMKSKKIRIFLYLLVGSVVFMNFFFLHFMKYQDEKKLIVQLKEAKAQVVVQDQELKKLKQVPNSFQIADPSVKPEINEITQEKYIDLNKVYNEPTTDNLTKKIIQKTMEDGVVTQEEYYQHSKLFSETIGFINQEKVRESLLESIK